MQSHDDQRRQIVLSAGARIQKDAVTDGRGTCYAKLASIVTRDKWQRSLRNRQAQHGTYAYDEPRLRCHERRSSVEALQPLFQLVQVIQVNLGDWVLVAGEEYTYSGRWSADLLALR